MTWIPIDKAEKLLPGVRYKSTYRFSLPYNDEIASLAARAGWAARHALALVGIILDGVGSSPPSSTPQLPGGRSKIWQIVVTWHRKG